MASHPWLKFYPRDWRGDQALRAVSIAARGLWMECLCIMHEAKPYGHLLLNGDPVGDDALARMAGTPVDEVSALMAELRQAGVLSVTRNGVVFSRRMTKDHARAQKGQDAASRRWSQVSDGVEQSGAPNGSPNGVPIENLLLRSQKAERRKDANASLSETSSDPPFKSRKRSSYPQDFERFWSEYPTDNLMSKKAAGQAWARMPPDARAEAIESVPAFKAYCAQHTDYRPVHANRYLVQERYVGFVEQARENASRVFVPKGSAAWDAWQRVRKTTSARSEATGEDGWWFPSEWPPESGLTKNSEKSW